ncbi:MAG TPA: hypothetical protein VNN18_01370 [Candidatus Xenobia bacterium]|nr:hypothetical protein [Candidatus Xenobia bacterium]
MQLSCNNVSHALAPLRRIALRVVFLACAFLPCGLAAPARAQGRAYFVAYDHHMEEPGALELSFNPALGVPKDGNKFLGAWMEFEYGATGWWTSEFYLDGQTTWNESTLFTGYRWENRFRPLLREHWINPVLYLEYEDVNEADKTIKDVVGFDSGRDLEPNDEARHEREREIELKLILSSNFKGWNLSENFIAAKNLAGEAWEFGYAVAVARPLTLAASAEDCTLCAENFRLGLELYGGLGDWHHFTLSETSHYLAPVVAWDLPSGVTLRFSPGFGLTSESHRALIRFGVSYEIAGFGPRLARMFR